MGTDFDPYRLPSGRKLHIYEIVYYRYDGELLEWNGVPPDVVVRQTAPDLAAKRDRQLEAAIEHLRSVGQ